MRRPSAVWRHHTLTAHTWGTATRHRALAPPPRRLHHSTGRQHGPRCPITQRGRLPGMAIPTNCAAARSGDHSADSRRRGRRFAARRCEPGASPAAAALGLARPPPPPPPWPPGGPPAPPSGGPGGGPAARPPPDRPRDTFRAARVDGALSRRLSPIFGEHGQCFVDRAGRRSRTSGAVDGSCAMHHWRSVDLSLSPSVVSRDKVIDERSLVQTALLVICVT